MTKFIKLYMILFATSLFAADNSIYIDQSGDNAVIDIVQSGGGNIIRGIQGVGTGNTTRAKMYGNNAAIDIMQTGSSNILSMGVNTTTAVGRAYGIDLTYYVTGNSGTAVINSNNAGSGTSGSNFIDVRQTGNTANLNLNILGSKNDFTATTTGGASNSIIANITGDSNINTIAVSGGGSNGITLTQTTSNADATFTVVGASNTINLTQTGVAGTTGHTFVYSLTGSSNSMTATQTGTIDTTVNVLSAGSGNTWNITTGN